ncbi:GDP-L-fucose synthase, partial [Bradyrhizobium sp. Mp64]|nr:GDP-L-fucose synthase [Bradyrhizobium sp. Mp64]
RREFLYVDDLADACIHLMKTYSSPELVNIGTGEDITIAEFALMVAAAVGFRGEISFDTSRPDGTPRKLLDISRLARLGWHAQTALEDGIQLAYRAYLADSKWTALLVPDKWRKQAHPRIRTRVSPSWPRRSRND